MFTFQLSLLFLVTIGHSRGQNGKGAEATSTDVSVGCFSGDSIVSLRNGNVKSISHLKTGDELLAVNHLNIVSTEMLFMLDQQRSRQATFYEFETASGHKLSVTGHHLIPIDVFDQQIRYIAAKHVQLGDQFYIRNDQNNQLEASPVVNITIESKIGYYAPLTMTGTLLVNNVYASCYALTKHHQWAHTFLSPFRWYYNVARFMSISDPFNVDNNQTDGIHWLVNILYQLIHLVRPSLLRNS